MIDVALAAFLLVLLSPLLILAALAVRLSTPGPVLFSQTHWGRGNRLFQCYKFRTMRVAVAEGAPALGVHDRMLGTLHKVRDDPRVTRVGAIFRRTSIDELPQLVNVLLGDMSLVGPRPLMTHMLEPYPQWRTIRGRFRPGITGLWQIRDREQSTNALAMATHDLEYIQTWSLTNDVRILALTVRAVISGKGAF